jgi:hypothetical protein
MLKAVYGGVILKWVIELRIYLPRNYTGWCNEKGNFSIPNPNAHVPARASFTVSLPPAIHETVFTFKTHQREKLNFFFSRRQASS